MATSLPPHNLREIAAAIRAVLHDPSVSLGALCAETYAEMILISPRTIGIAILISQTRLRAC